MKTPRLTPRARWVALSALLALIWFGAPHPAGGLWRGSYFACLCSADVVAEFRGGGVFTHLDPWAAPTGSPAIRGQISTKPAGSYRRTGWYTFEWSQPTSHGEVQRLQFSPGWILCRVEDPESGEVWWGVREYSLPRILRIRGHRDHSLQP